MQQVMFWAVGAWLAVLAVSSAGLVTLVAAQGCLRVLRRWPGAVARRRAQEAQAADRPRGRHALTM
ncbi:MAG: hypothetical protein JWL64_1758 [Frankiales bacterium]|nr:hypothetical protein [Frankiales bacterium]